MGAPSEQGPPTDSLVRLEVRGAVATVILDSPANRNALSRRLVADLTRQLDVAAADESVRVVVVGSSSPVFCSGADMREAVADGMQTAARELVALQRQLVTLPVPVLVRLDGPVRAGGLGIVAAADVVVAAEQVSFALTEVRLGLAPAVVSLTVLPRLTARAASWAALSGACFDARQAVEYGLVSRAVPADTVDTAVEELVAEFRLATRQGLRETKSLLNAPLLTRIDELGEQAAALSAQLFASDEARKAMAAFLDRQPR